MSRLNSEDADLVDWLLDPAQGAGDGDVEEGGPLRQRLRVVEQWFHLLDAMPATEPPPDLRARTLQRVTGGAQAH